MLNDIVDPKELDRHSEQLWLEVYNKVIEHGESEDIARQMADRVEIGFRVSLSTPPDHEPVKKHSTSIN
ncbi:MAG TPA: hypothetical protein VG759_22215 [Candidatus Angelobacter sp.]|nr:hypothetical protein [Candidatus Angelobacter sp.]